MSSTIQRTPGAALIVGILPLVGCFFNPKGLGADTDGGSAGGTAQEPTSSATQTPTSGTTGPNASPLCAGPGSPPDDILDGFIGTPYTYELMPMGDMAPYTAWFDNGTLPPGLSIDAATGVISGTPTELGSFAVQLTATGADSKAVAIDCGVLAVREPVAVDHKALLALAPKGCISYGVTMDSLLANGVIIPVKDAKDAPTCTLEPGRGNGNSDFDGDSETEFPPGIVVDPASCELTGVLNPSLRYGIYTWIVTVNQSGSKAYLPYCAPQNQQPGTAYAIKREDAGALATFNPGLVILPAQADALFSYGSADPDPKVTITYNKVCAGACFYAYLSSYNTLSQANVSFNPSGKFPMSGFEGFTHAIRVAENDADFLNKYRSRAFVVKVDLDYCIAENDADCGNSLSPGDPTKTELIRENGGGSNYSFGLIVLPEG